MRLIALPDALADKLRELVERGITPEELIIEALGGLNPHEKAEAYWEIAEHYLKRAEEELSKGDLREASEKVWSAAALAVKASAYEREGRRLTSHGELWAYVAKLKKEEPVLGGLWRTAISMHVNFYEGWAPEEEVREALSKVRELVERLRAISAREGSCGGPGNPTREKAGAHREAGEKAVSRVKRMGRTGG